MGSLCTGMGLSGMLITCVETFPARFGRLQVNSLEHVSCEFF